MIDFELMLPTEKDIALLTEWRNDPVALAMSLSYTSPKTAKTFFPEFLRRYYTIPELPPLFAIANGEKVGALRFDPADARQTCEISLIVAPQHRGKGIGAAILKAINPFLERQGITKILAQIKKENLASIKTFSKAGYQMVRGGETLLFALELRDLTESKVFIIAEAGSNWKDEGAEASLIRAKKMIDAAHEAGADAVKFQTFRADKTYVSNAGISDYLADKDDIGSILRKLEMPEEMIPQLAEYCQKKGIEFLSSVFSESDFKRIDPYVKRHKIASYEISHTRLLELAGRSNKPLILSTGAANASDIDWAVDTFYQSGGKNLTLLQCTARYPAPDYSLQLQVIPWLKSRYQTPVGLSDHSLDPVIAPVGAVMLGAEMIEKHFTLDRKLKGPDHTFSIEANELKQMVYAIRSAEKMRGSGLKKIQPAEEELYYFARRGIQALRDIQQGEILLEGSNIAILRPGKRKLGLHPRHLPVVEGRRTARAIAQGEGIQFEDI